MKKYPFIAALLIASTLLVATTCDKCEDQGDCLIPPFDWFYFTYENSEGDDLLAGASQKYEAGDIKVFSLDEDDNKVQADVDFIPGTTTIVHVTLERTVERAFLEVEGEVTDTLDLEFHYHKTECCGTASEIEEVTLNGELYTGNLFYPVEIKEQD